MVEGLSKALDDVDWKRIVIGIKVGRLEKFIHLLYGDDFLLLCFKYELEFNTFRDILLISKETIGMKVNDKNICFVFIISLMKLDKLLKDISFSIL